MLYQFNFFETSSTGMAHAHNDDLDIAPYKPFGLHPVCFKYTE